ncbi:hypothetical protein GCM10023149_25940 [Mucilaginibacter gynuensis]|uniref:Lipocalin-like protein n=1 Tax=Mucilaginibacter gynuensis TaxID=1302236 RepID=A0ABP8GHC3_9SPHI
MKVKLVYTALFLIISNQLFAQQSVSHFEKDKLYGYWKVKDHLHDEEAAYSKIKLNQYSKKTIFFSEKDIQFFFDKISSPSYSLKSVPSTFYLSDMFNADKKYFQVLSDTLISITINGVLNSKNKKRSKVEYNLFYDGRYLYLVIDGATFRLYKYN